MSWWLWLACTSDPTTAPRATDATATATGTTGDTGATSVHTGGHTAGPAHTAGHTGHTGHTGAGVIHAVPDTPCPLLDTVGRVSLMVSPGNAPSLSGDVWDRADPWIGPPVLTNATCEHHRFDPASCRGCPPGETCAYGGTCEPERHRRTDVTLVVSTGGQDRTYVSDPVDGLLWGNVDIGDETSAYGMELTFGDVQIHLDPTVPASGDLQDLEVTVASADFFRPGALDASWAPPPDGGHVTCVIPINHHAAGPTFTSCVVPASSGGFHADAAMVDPLAVITGLEFQGLEHVRLASAWTPDGCIEFRSGLHLYVFPTPP